MTDEQELGPVLGNEALAMWQDAISQLVRHEDAYTGDLSTPNEGVHRARLRLSNDPRRATVPLARSHKPDEIVTPPTNPRGRIWPSASANSLSNAPQPERHNACCGRFCAASAPQKVACGHCQYRPPHRARPVDHGDCREHPCPHQSRCAHAALARHLTHHNKPTPAAGDRFFDSDDPPYVFCRSSCSISNCPSTPTAIPPTTRAGALSCASSCPHILVGLG